MINKTEHLSVTNESKIVGEKIIGAETQSAEKPISAEDTMAEIEKAQEAAQGRVGQLIKSVQTKVGPTAKEVLSDTGSFFREKARQLKIEFEMRQTVKRRVEALGEFTSEEATAHLGEIFGYQEAKFSREETTDIGQDIIQKFFGGTSA